MKHFAIAVIAGATVSGALTGAASAQTTTTAPPATTTAVSGTVTPTTTPISYVGSTSIGTGLQCLLEGISALTPGGPGFSCYV